MRKASVHGLSPTRVESFQVAREEEVSLMIQNISKAIGPIDVSETVISTTNGIISRVAFGRKYYIENESGAKFCRLFAELSTLLATVLIGDIYPMFAWVGKLSDLDARLRKNFQEWNEFLDMVIEEHLDPCRAVDGGDRQNFVDILLDIENKGDIGLTLGRDGIKGILLVTNLA